MTRGALAGVLLAGTLAVSASAAEDDLAVVKRAVQEERVPERPATRPRGTAPTWLHVRVQDKGEKQARVSVNVPLALVAALGTDCPASWHCDKLGKDGKAARLSDLLATLESGQEIVQVDDQEHTVRVWVD